MKKTDGFTLIELLVGILCAALITGAAMSMLLMGARTNRALLDANTDQQNARILMSLIDRLASENKINTVEIRGELDSPSEDGYRDWALLDDNGSPILHYTASEQAIYSSSSTPIMTGVISSALTLSSASKGGCLLGFSIQTADTFYESASYCRVSSIETDGIVLDKNDLSASVSDKVEHPEDDVQTVKPSEDTSSGRMALLEILCRQYGSTGNILGGQDSNGYQYFSEWYIKDPGYINAKDWNENTPWCACFLSWAAAQLPEGTLKNIPYFANVTTGYNTFTGDYRLPANTPHTNIRPGDFIFFSWDNDPNTLEHVGAVFAVDNTWVYTIEGNSGGKVALHRYLLEDNSIVGYGVLDWKTTS